MGSKGGNDQVQRSEPWAPQSPFLQDTFQQAQNLFNSGGPQYFPNATYTPFSQQTEQGLGLTEQRALSGSPVTGAAQDLATQSLNSNPQFAGAQNYLQQPQGLGQFSQFAGAGQSPQIPGQGSFQQPQLAGLGGVGQGVQGFGQASNFANVGAGQDNANAQQLAGVGPTQGLNAATQQFTSQLSGLPSATSNALGQTAQGQSLNGNPYLNDQFDQAAKRVTDTFNRDISPGLAAQFSAAGRSGSDAQADVQTQAAGQVSDSLSELATNIYGGNYQRERDRQLQAAGQLGSLSQSQQGLGLQAAGQGADLYNAGQSQDIQRRSLAGNLSGQAAGQDIQRRSLAAGIYGQGQQQDIARRGLESGNILGASQQGLGARGQDVQSGLGAGQQDISRLGLAGQLYGQQQQQQLGASGIDAGVYGQQLGQQNNFANLANSLANQDYTDIDRLLGVGGRVEGLSNQALQDQLSRFNHYQNLPQQNLQNYIAAIYGHGNVGGQQIQEAPEPSRLQGAAGGALTGYSVGGPYGAVAGGILGALG